jgi:hypothetical protein
MVDNGQTLDCSRIGKKFSESSIKCSYYDLAAIMLFIALYMADTMVYFTNNDGDNWSVQEIYSV